MNVPERSLGYAPERQVLEAREPVGAHHDQVALLVSVGILDGGYRGVFSKGLGNEHPGVPNLRRRGVEILFRLFVNSGPISVFERPRKLVPESAEIERQNRVHEVQRRFQLAPESNSSRQGGVRDLRKIERDNQVRQTCHRILRRCRSY
jgi:hypothetical protein